MSSSSVTGSGSTVPLPLLPFLQKVFHSSEQPLLTLIPTKVVELIAIYAHEQTHTSSSPSPSTATPESVHSTPLSHIHPSAVPDEWTVEYEIERDENGAPLLLQHPPSIHCMRVNSEPLMIRVENFLTADECQQILKLAYAPDAPAWKPYRNITYKPQIDEATGEVVSQEFIVGYSKEATLFQLDYGHYQALHPYAYLFARRISKIANLPPSRSSNLRRILRYKPGQKFDLHADDYDRLVPLHRGRRLLTCLIYVKTEEDETGGGTVFPLLNSGPYRSPPISGSLLIFRNFDPQNDFHFDSRAQHYAETTTKGSKYAINMYFVEQDGQWWH